MGRMDGRADRILREEADRGLGWARRAAKRLTALGEGRFTWQMCMDQAKARGIKEANAIPSYAAFPGLPVPKAPLAGSLKTVGPLRRMK